MLHETFQICSRVKINNQSSKDDLKKLACELMNPLFIELKENPEIFKIFIEFGISLNDDNINIDKLFPTEI